MGRVLRIGLLRVEAARALAFGLACAFVIGLRSCYIDVLTPMWGYYGLVAKPVPLGVELAAVAIALAPVAWMRLTLDRASDAACWLVYACVVVPVAVVCPRIAHTSAEDALVLAALVTAAFGLMDGFRRGPTWRAPYVVVGSPQLARWVIVGATGGLALMLAWGAREFLSLSLDLDYTRRMTARGWLEQSAIFSYALGLLSKGLIPITLAYSVVTRRASWAVVGLTASLIVFAVDAAKSALILPIVVVGALAGASWGRGKPIGLWMLGALAVVVWLTLPLGHGTVGFFLSDFVIRRGMVAHGELTQYYWEYYSHHPLPLMMDGPLGALFGYRGVPSPPRVIGAVFFGRPEANANANIWASGFAHFGLAGIFAASLGAGLVLRMLDSFGEKGQYPIACAAASSFALIWNDTAFHSSLITHGVLALLMCMSVLGPCLGPGQAEDAPQEPRPGGFDEIGPDRAEQPG